MSAETFEYLCAETVDQALELLAANPDAAVLSSGHSFLPALKAGEITPDTVVDIGGLDALRGVTDDDNTIRVGASTTYATLVDSDTLQNAAGVLPAAARETADVQIRNRGTVGGNLARPYAVSDLSAAVVAADATLAVRNHDNRRRVDAERFFTGTESTALDDDELLTAIEVPAKPAAGGAYVKQTGPSSRYTLVGVAARLRVTDGAVTTAGVAAVGATEQVVRLPAVEDALETEPLSDERVADAAARATTGLTDALVADDQASAEFREQLLAVNTERALDEAAERARAADST